MHLIFIMSRNSKFGWKIAYKYATSKTCVGNFELFKKLCNNSTS